MYTGEVLAMVKIAMLGTKTITRHDGDVDDIDIPSPGLCESPGTINLDSEAPSF